MKGISSEQSDLFGNTVSIVIPERVRTMVERVLAENPKARDNDMVLLQKVWEAQGYTFGEGFSREAFAAETVCRWRRKLQEQGRFPASPKAQKDRDNKEGEYRKDLKRFL